MAKSFITGQIPFVVNIEQKQKPRIDTIKENGEYNTEAYRGVNIQVPGATTKDLFEAVANGTYDIAEYAKVKVDVPNPSTGTKDITANGNNIDVKDYAAVNVNVPNPSSGTLQITENGEGINVTNYAYVDVNVSGSGSFFKQLHYQDYIRCAGSINPQQDREFTFIPEGDPHPGSYAYIEYSIDSTDGKPVINASQYEGFSILEFEGDDVTSPNLSHIHLDSEGNSIIVILGVGSEDLGIHVYYDGESECEYPFNIGFVNSSLSSEQEAIDLLTEHYGDSFKVIDITGTVLATYYWSDCYISIRGGC